MGLEQTQWQGSEADLSCRRSPPDDEAWSTTGLSVFLFPCDDRTEML